MKKKTAIKLSFIGLLLCLSASVYALPDSAAIDYKLLNEMEEAIKENSYDIHSIVICKDGNTLYEKYYAPYKKNTLHITHHIINTVIGCCIGICIDEGLIKNADTKIAGYFPEYRKYIKDNRQYGITIKNLLTMTAGYRWSSEHDDEPIKELIDNPELSEYMFSLNLSGDPGLARNQNSGSIYLLVKIIEKVSGSSIDQFIRKKIFSPLSITDFKIERDPTGKTKGPYALYMRPIDLIKLGQLFLDNGEWNGKQIVSEAWGGRVNFGTNDKENYKTGICSGKAVAIPNNPYIVGNPAKAREMFFGRQAA